MSIAIIEETILDIINAATLAIKTTAHDVSTTTTDTTFAKFDVVTLGRRNKYAVTSKEGILSIRIFRPTTTSKKIVIDYIDQLDALFNNNTVPAGTATIEFGPSNLKSLGLDANKTDAVSEYSVSFKFN